MTVKSKNDNGTPPLLPYDKRKEHIARIFIRNAGIDHAWEVLEYNFNHGVRLREASTGYIIGHSRCGKSETIKRFIHQTTGVEIKTRANEPDKTDIKLCEGNDVRLIYADMTNGMTPRIASTAILKDVFSALQTAKTGESEGARDLIKHFNKHRIDMLVIDEAQQMFNGHGPGAAQKLGKWLLPLENAASFSIVLAGAPELENLHKTVEAANLRKAGKAKLKPYEFRTSGQKAEFRRFLRQFAVQLPYSSSCLFDGDGKFVDELLFPMYYATRGRPGEIAKLFEQATYFAFKDKESGGNPERLTVDHISAAFDFNLLNDHRMENVNPFRAKKEDFPTITQCLAEERASEEAAMREETLQQRLRQRRQRKSRG
jgi:hypothetical protein